MYVDLQLTPAVKAVPTALVVQSLNILEQGSESLRETVDAFILSNPLLDFVQHTPHFDAFDYACSKAASQVTLSDHLLQQLHLSQRSPLLLRICRFIIDSLDDAGYLRDDMSEMIHMTHSTPALFERCLSIIQGLEPCGVGARSLSECLRLQLEARETPSPLAIEIVSHHLEDFGLGRLRLDGYSAAQIEAASALIRSLQPRPGTQYHNETTHYIIPDIQIEVTGGILCVSLINQPACPSINSQYQEFLKTEDEMQRQYIQQNLLYARSFIYALRERGKTMLAISQRIVDHQSAYLLTGSVATLRPMTLTDMACALNISLSTISRAVNGKYVRFQNRNFPLRSLFTLGGNRDHSREEILHRITALSEANSSGEALTDRRIAQLLSEDGIHISRRTVNKYRNRYLQSKER